MKVSKVQNYKNPNYPTRLDVISDPACLKNNIPDRWIDNKVVTAALAVYMLAGQNNSGGSIPKMKERII